MSYHTGRMKLYAGSRVIIPVADETVASVQLVDNMNVWSTAVIEVKVSNTQTGPWYSLPVVASLSAAGMLNPIDVSSVQFIAIEVTTSESSSSTDEVLYYVCAK